MEQNRNSVNFKKIAVEINLMKALVFFGTRWGGTVDIAQSIGEALKKSEYNVDVIDARKKSPGIEGYDLIIIGSGIRADKWTRETMKFLEKNALLLRQKKTALFVSCQMADGNEEAREKAKETYLHKISESFGIKPIAYGLFGGFLDFKKSHGLLVDIIVRVNGRNLRKNGLDTRKTYDTRNWKKIEAWAIEVGEAASQKDNP